MDNFIAIPTDSEWSEALVEDAIYNDGVLALKNQIQILVHSAAWPFSLSPDDIFASIQKKHIESQVDFSYPIDMLDLSGNSKNRLKYMKIFTIGQLVQRTRMDLLNNSYIGHNTLNDIIGALNKYWWALGMGMSDGRPSEDIPGNMADAKDGSQEAMENKDSEKVLVDLFSPISALRLSTRAFNCLKSERIHYVGELIQSQLAQLQLVPNLGEGSIRNIEEGLARYGLSLGTQLDKWVSPILSCPITDLSMDLDKADDIYRCLRLADIFYIGELVQKTDAEVKGLSNFIGNHMGDIRHALRKFRLSLGMRLNNWTRPQ